MKSAKEWWVALKDVKHSVILTDLADAFPEIVEAIREEQREACANAGGEAVEGDGRTRRMVFVAIRNAGKAPAIKPGMLISAVHWQGARRSVEVCWQGNPYFWLVAGYIPLAKDDIEWRGDGWYFKEAE